MSDISFVLIIALIAIGIGYAIGSLVTSARSERKPEEGSKKPPVANFVNVANIMTDRGGKAVYLQVDGKVLRSPNEVSREQRTRLAHFFEVLSSWFVISMTPKTTSKMTSPGSYEYALSGEAEIVDASLAQQNAKRPSLDPVELLSRALQTDVKAPDEALKSISAQIDEILQERIKNTDVEKSGVRLIELPNKGMVVMVGLNQYESVDEVPDEDVRRAIRSAVEEWEKL